MSLYYNDSLTIMTLITATVVSEHVERQTHTYIHVDNHKYLANTINEKEKKK